MREADFFGDAICACSDAAQVADVLKRAQLDDAVFRGLAVALAADVLHIASDFAARMAVEAATSGCTANMLNLVKESLLHSCATAPNKAARFARIAVRISLCARHEGPMLIAAVCAAAEAAMLSSGTRGSTQAIRLHQGDVARTFISPKVFG